MIARLSMYDFDGTLIDSPVPDTGRNIWKQRTGEEYPHVGWWGRPESLDKDVFDIKPFPAVANQLNDDMARSDTYTIILTSRLERLRPQLEAILEEHGIKVDRLLTKKGGMEKSERIEQLLEQFPNVKEVNVYEDRDKEFKVFHEFKTNRPDLQVNIYKADDGKISLLESLADEIYKIITEEIKKGLTKPKELMDKTDKADGVSLGRDKKGYFVYTHRARSKSYESPEKIPVKDIEYIETTG